MDSMPIQKPGGLPPIAYIMSGLLIAGGGYWWLTHQNSDKTSFDPGLSRDTGAGLSSGSKILVSTVTSPEKQAGVKALESGNKEEAIAQFQQALKKNRNDTETLVYLNNVKAGDTTYSIGVSVPIHSGPNGAQEILRGVAQAQRDINQGGGINGTPLAVLIADDKDNAEVAQDIAQKFVDKSGLTGVVSHYSSDVTLAAGKVYNNRKLPVISPIRTSVKLSNFSPYVFRTVPRYCVALSRGRC
jgi:branched-chain amino acid transport system substrate-binding protein